ncbi:MAG: 16S rRNA (cytosine(967)-C(5))-methyltransferase RsmB [Motiliproteus sp.]
MSVRMQAAKVLTTILKQEGSLSTALPEALENTPEKDRPLLQQLCYGSLRILPRLQLISEQLLSKSLKRKDQDIQALILLGLYQLLETRIPAHAAIGESVEAALQLKKSWAKGLINGVLREFQRQPELIDELMLRANFRFCHPKWFITQLKQYWPEYYQQILEQNNQQAPMTLRVNLSRNSRENYSQKLQKLQISHRLCAYSEAGITLEKATEVDALPEFWQGAASVQDEAAQLAIPLLDLKPGQRVLDACSAPGGKTGHLLEAQGDIDYCLALDLKADRLAKVQQNMDRIGLTCELKQADASSAEWWDGSCFDRILLDAPCSATGVIRRNPDIKYLRQAEDIITLSELQLKILNNLWPMLAAGGRLVYATCSVLPKENAEVVSQFLANQVDATEIPIDADWGLKQKTGRQLFPQPNGHDGFYYAVLEKAPN